MEENADRISRLPDTLLICDILSRLPFKMAVRTSILATRWRFLWTSAVNLDFDTEIWDSFTSGEGSMDHKREAFVLTVDNFLDHHRGPNVKRFRLYFYPSEENQPHIIKWIKFAARKRVEEVDINYANEFGEFFDLPLSILECRSVVSLKLSFCDFRIQSGIKNWQSLKTLNLKQVQITDDIVTSLLSECNHLEEMYLIECNDLINLQIKTRDSRFRSLTVVYGWNLCRIEIDAPDLLSFHFSGNHIHFLMKNISGLQDALLNIFGDKIDNIDGEIVLLGQDPRALLLSFSHVKILTVNAFLIQTVYKESHMVANVPIVTQFQNLKELQVLMEGMSFWDLNALSMFLNLSPCLEKLFIEIEDKYSRWEIQPKTSRYVHGPVSPHLKTVKIKGFTGLPFDVALVNHILLWVESLESIVIVPSPNYELNDIINNILLDLQRDQPEEPLSFLAEVLSMFAPSGEQKIKVVEHSDDRNVEGPTHQEVYGL